MKIRVWLSVISLTMTLGLYQNCSEVVFSENPTVFSSDSATFDTSDMLGAEFYKVVLVLDPSSSMNDDLVKLSAAMDRVIEAAKGYNIKFYIYDTNAQNRVSINSRTLGLRQEVIQNTEAVTEVLFTLKDGNIIKRPISEISKDDWSSYEYDTKLKAPIAFFEINKNSTQQDILNVKNQLREIVIATQPVGSSSTEFGICTLKRILSNKSDTGIIFEGDKINFILISDEDNGGLQDTNCVAGGTVVKNEAIVQDKYCVNDFKGSGGQRGKQNAKDCDDNFDSNALAYSSSEMTIGNVIMVIQRVITYEYKNIDTIVKSNLEVEVNYNYEEVIRTQSICNESEFARVRELVRARTGDAENLIKCEVTVQNDGRTFSIGNISIPKQMAITQENINRVNRTFLGKHCNSNSEFFDIEKNRVFASYKHALVSRMEERNIMGVDPNKIEFATCVQKLSISHLGEGSENPLAFLSPITALHTPKTFDSVKVAADQLLGTDNYVVSSFHHSAALDSGLCSLDPQEGSFGVSQDQLITSLGQNGFSQSICSSDYSQSLIQFAARFIKDQHRTFTLLNYRRDTEIMSIRINGREIVGIHNSYRLIGNRLTISEGFINQGDLIEVDFRYPVN